MPFLQLSGGQSRVLEILSEKAEVQFQHWIQGVAFECGGDKCPFCAQGARKNARFVMQVRGGGEDLTWPMGKRVYTMLTFISASRPSFKGLTVKLSRIGEGRDTQWLVEEVKASEAQAVPVAPVPAATSTVVVSEAVSQAFLQIAAMEKLRGMLTGPALEGLEATITALKDKTAADMAKLGQGKGEEIQF